MLDGLRAEDEASKLVATGKLEDLEALRGIVNLLDVPRNRVLVLIVKINSPLDHLSYKVRAELRDQQEWNTTDSEIGLSLGITPRVNADYSVTIHLVYVLDKRVQSESMVRVANGSSFFTDGSHFTSGTPVPIGEKKLPVVAILVQLKDAPYVPVHRDPVP